MSQLIASSKCVAVIGTGLSGLSVARYLQRNHQKFVLFDTRVAPPNADLVASEFPQVPVEYGQWNEELLHSMEEIIVSPGVSLKEPALVRAKKKGIALVGDIELFRRSAKAPIVAITGSNAKSTVTTWVAQMAKLDGIKVAVGGNLGTPALDLLSEDVELYVLELSSFQLDTISKLNAKVATVLNVSPDHMDRYESLAAYHSAKQRIYFGAEHVVVNRQDMLTRPPISATANLSSFGGAADFKNAGTLQKDGELWLADELSPILRAADIRLPGEHNIANALAAIAVAKAAGVSRPAIVRALQEFSGLPHRCQWVARVNAVDYVNDSKGTNVGATLAAVNGLGGAGGKLVVLLGGEAKDADFSALVPALQAHARCAIVYGRDASQILQGISAFESRQQAGTMLEACALASRSALAGDTVLLSPACASFDEFTSFTHRGEVFTSWVEEVADA